MSTIFGFFGLRENPFKINPDPRFLFITEQTRATSAELVYAIRSRKGLVLLTGEVGTGKTMLIRRLLDWLTEQNMPTALIFNSHIQPEHLLDLILNDFGVPCASTLKSEKLMALNRWLLDRYRAGQTPVLIVDEAQGLEPAALEEIRLLLNFETPREKLLQIVLAGQPELQINLKRHELRQLRQRITVRCTTAPLTLEQTYGYIRERLRIAGADGTPIFDPDAVGAIHAYSRGIPRVINVLAEHSLINACADGVTTVSAAAVEQAAHDCQLDRVDSVARILSTGSYSTTSLSDIGSLLASISAQSDSIPGPIHEPEFAEPPRHDASPVQAVEPRGVPEAQPVFQALSETTQAAFNQGLPAEPAARSRPTPLHVLGLWSASFVADLRASSRRFHRAVRSFEAGRWNPFIQGLRRQLHQFRLHASRLSSDPRWKDIRAKAASVSQRCWTYLKFAIRPPLADRLGERQHESRRTTQVTAASRVRRHRAIFSLRRWLHEPLTTQQKRTEGNQRGSLG